MDRAEELFLHFISTYTVEDIQAAIFHDFDLGQLVREEIPDYVEGFKMFVEAYNRSHQGWREKAHENPQLAAEKIINFLKQHRPELGHEIDSYKQRPTASRAGFVTSVATTTTLTHDPNRHAGKEWVAKNLLSLEEVFFS